MKKFVRSIVVCVGAPLLAAGIALPSASADPTTTPPPAPTQPSEDGVGAGIVNNYKFGEGLNVGADVP